MAKVSIIYHSGYGHTEKVAQHVLVGVKSVSGVDGALISVDSMSDKDWVRLDESDAIIFGCPTYMGSVSAKFKGFMEVASSRWQEQAWKDKLAAGFTNSMGMSGDKLSTLSQLYINAMQHGMVWVSLGLMAPMYKGLDTVKTSDLNRLGSYSGLMTQANNDAPEIAPPKGDLDTAEKFGERVAGMATKFFG